MAAATRVLGQETWFNCVSLLTHGCTAPPDTPQGQAQDYSRALEMRKRNLSAVLKCPPPAACPHACLRWCSMAWNVRSQAHLSLRLVWQHPGGLRDRGVPVRCYLSFHLSTSSTLRRSAAGDARIQPPILAVENAPGCRHNAKGEPLLPNDQAWRPELMLTMLVSRLLAQADAALDMPVSCPSVVAAVRLQADADPAGSLPAGPLAARGHHTSIA